MGYRAKPEYPSMLAEAVAILPEDFRDTVDKLSSLLDDLVANTFGFLVTDRKVNVRDDLICHLVWELAKD